MHLIIGYCAKHLNVKQCHGKNHSITESFSIRNFPSHLWKLTEEGSKEY